MKKIQALLLAFALILSYSINIFSYSTSKFTDIENHWAREVILEMVEAGYIKGTSSTTISPDENLTKAQWLTMLYRLLALEEDNNNEKWYMPAYNFAVKNEIISEISKEELFQNITREETIFWVHNAYKKLGENYSMEKVEAIPFKDFEDIDKEKVPAVLWGVQAGIIKGRTNGNFDPKGYLTRGEGIVIMRRIIYYATRHLTH